MGSPNCPLGSIEHAGFVLTLPKDQSNKNCPTNCSPSQTFHVFTHIYPRGSKVGIASSHGVIAYVPSPRESVPQDMGGNFQAAHGSWWFRLLEARVSYPFPNPGKAHLSGLDSKSLDFCVLKWSPFRAQKLPGVSWHSLQI